MSLHNKHDDLNLQEELDKMAKETIGTVGKDAYTENLSTAEVLERFRDTLISMIKPFAEKVDVYMTAIKDMGGFTQLLKTAWNLEEENVAAVSFEDIVTWSKQYFDKESYSAACFLAPQKKGIFSRDTSMPKEYHLFFIDKQKNPLLDGSAPHKIFYAKMLDRDLQVQLSDKNMLLLQ